MGQKNEICENLSKGEKSLFWILLSWSNEEKTLILSFSHDNKVKVKYIRERPYICNEYDECEFERWFVEEFNVGY